MALLLFSFVNASPEQLVKSLHLVRTENPQDFHILGMNLGEGFHCKPDYHSMKPDG